MRNSQLDAMFNYIIKNLDQQSQTTLSMMYNNYCFNETINHRREMEQMKKEITDDVLSRISIRLDDEALKQLRDMLKSIGL